jgi:2,4-dienoyl-CoA reductase-like NADH-dependent reductase (Old Yellow Enzyme family)
MIPLRRCALFTATADRYGRRLAFAEELLSKVRRAVGEDYPVFFWLSVDDGIGAEAITLELSMK